MTTDVVTLFKAGFGEDSKPESEIREISLGLDGDLQLDPHPPFGDDTRREADEALWGVVIVCKLAPN